MVFMDCLVVVYSICALRTNVILFMILFLLIPTFALLASVFFHAAQGITVANQLVAAGALAFVISMLGWYIFLAILLAAVDFPLSLPGELPRI